MDLSPYVESVRTGVANAAALADEHSQQVALKLGTALESSTRLALIQALSDAAGNISADLAPSSVELRMSGGEPEFVVTVSQPSGEPTLLVPPQDSEPTSEDVDAGEEPVARISLRLPASVKAKVDEAATSEGISTNAWLMRAVMDALGDRRRGDGWPRPPQPPGPPGVFGPNGPFGEHGPFGASGIFGPGGAFGSERSRGGGKRRRGDGASGNVQGWVR